MRTKALDYLELTKPRIVSLVLVTAAIGFFLGGQSLRPFSLLFYMLIGTALSCGGAAVLNCFLEREADAKMKRTCKRVLPSGKISPADALGFGLLLVLLGTILLVWKVNLLTGFLALLTTFLYVLVYTPLKKVTWLNTFIGAIPGALPPLGGWAAATGELSLGAWVLFAILFVWQHPHFYAIAWMYKDDYGRGGFKMLPVVEPDGKSTFRQIVVYSLILIPVSLLPTIIGMSGYIYFWGALFLGCYMLLEGLSLYRTKTASGARGLLRTSIIYLPLLLILIVTDVGF